VFLLSCLHRELVLSLMEEEKEGSKELDMAQQTKKARLLHDSLLPEGMNYVSGADRQTWENITHGVEPGDIPSKLRLR
jgi:hypothetical protein